MTNGDLIRSFSDEELECFLENIHRVAHLGATLITILDVCPTLTIRELYLNNRLDEVGAVYKWLQSEVTT